MSDAMYNMVMLTVQQASTGHWNVCLDGVTVGRKRSARAVRAAETFAKNTARVAKVMAEEAMPRAMAYVLTHLVVRGTFPTSAA